MITIKKFSPELVEAYDSFLLKHPHAMFYHTSSYLLFIQEFTAAEQETLIAFHDNQVIGCLPMLSKKGKFGKVLNSLPFYGSHGSVLASTPEASGALLDRLDELKRECLSSVFVMNLFEANDCGRYGSKVDGRIGQLTRLPENPEALMPLFDKKTRNMVRKAEKLGIKVNVANDDLPFLIQTHSENMAQIGGKAKPESFFNLIPNYFRVDTDYKIYTATLNGNRVASLLLFYYKNFIEYYTPVIAHEYRDSQGLSLIIHEAMKDGIQNGFHLWNWGGTWKTQEGVYRFKSRFGAEDIEYNYYMTSIEGLTSYPLKEVVSEYPWFYVGPYSMWESANV